ncbi:MAG: hypothetical protein LBQ08_00420 [Holosporaceae bacterium]|jgi:hypothetical protein|nr:hypothetical protein [Holosporaceae bacterium]
MKMKSVLCGLALAGMFLGGIVDVEAGRGGRSGGRGGSAEQSVAPQQYEGNLSFNKHKETLSSREAFAACMAIIDQASLEEHQKVSIFAQILLTLDKVDKKLKNEVLKMCNEKMPASDINGNRLFTDRVNETIDETAIYESSDSRYHNQYSDEPATVVPQAGGNRRGRR